MELTTKVKKVRKQFVLNKEKIRTVKEITDSKTETEAIDKAMDLVIAGSKINEALIDIKGKGIIEDIYGKATG